MTTGQFTFDEGKRRPRKSDVRPVLAIVADGKSLRSACRELGIHPGGMSEMLSSTEELRAQYAGARASRSDYLAEQALNIGLAAATGQLVDGHKILPDGARVAVDAIKWAAARMHPAGAPVQKFHLTYDAMPDEAIDKRLALLLKKGGVDEVVDESGKD